MSKGKHEKLKNLSIFGILMFPSCTNSKNLLILQNVKFWKFVNFSIRKILETCQLFN